VCTRFHQFVRTFVSRPSAGSTTGSLVMPVRADVEQVRCTDCGRGHGGVAYLVPLAPKMHFLALGVLGQGCSAYAGVGLVGCCRVFSRNTVSFLDQASCVFDGPEP